MIGIFRVEIVDQIIKSVILFQTQLLILSYTISQIVTTLRSVAVFVTYSVV